MVLSYDWWLHWLGNENKLIRNLDVCEMDLNRPFIKNSNALIKRKRN